MSDFNDGYRKGLETGCSTRGFWDMLKSDEYERGLEAGAREYERRKHTESLEYERRLREEHREQERRDERELERWEREKVHRDQEESLGDKVVRMNEERLRLQLELSERAQSKAAKVQLLRPIGQEILVQPTDGREVISKSRGYFKSGLVQALPGVSTDYSGSPTDRARAQIYQVIVNSTLGEIVDWLGKGLDSHCLTPSQIIQINKNHIGMLLAGVSFVFFLKERGGNITVRTGVTRWSGNPPFALISQFSRDEVLLAENIGERLILKI